MRLIRNEKGIALMMVMVMATISLAVMAALLYMVTIGAKMSGINKRFQTSLEAGRSGVGFIEAVVAGHGAISNELAIAINYQLADPANSCLATKIRFPTTEWDTSVPNCSRSFAIDVTNTATYDFSFEMGSYIVRSKIVDTVDGNATGQRQTGDGWTQGGVVWGKDGIDVSYIPALHTIEMDVRNMANDSERNRLSLLFRY